jgi:hypothetical protein
MSAGELGDPHCQIIHVCLFSLIISFFSKITNLILLSLTDRPRAIATV